MARTLLLRFNNGYTPDVELVHPTTFAVVATISMTNVAGTLYTGDIPAGVGANDYFVEVKVGAQYLGYGEVTIAATDNTVYRVRPTVHVQEIGATAANKQADHVLRRNQANVEASANGDTLDVESLYGDIQARQNASQSGSVLTVKKTDDTTLGTLTITTDPNALPVSAIAQT